jgi:FAD/FMN-containing dehydrogenase
LNIACDSYKKDIIDTIEPFIYEWLSKNGGSISAEHGLGLMKAKHISYSKSENLVESMKHIKALFDPLGIMNPYKYLP